MNHKKITKSGKYNSLQGKFTPLHPDKFKGDVFPHYKSKLELKMMTLLDKSPSVESWNYERIVIPYLDKTRHGTKHNYYMDFKVVMKTNEGPKTFLIEVKSKKETEPPKKSKRKKPETYKKEMETYIRNKCKWKAADIAAKRNGWNFRIFTEDNLR